MPPSKPRPKGLNTAPPSAASVSSTSSERAVTVLGNGCAHAGCATVEPVASFSASSGPTTVSTTSVLSSRPTEVSTRRLGLVDVSAIDAAGSVTVLVALDVFCSSNAATAAGGRGLAVPATILLYGSSRQTLPGKWRDPGEIEPGLESSLDSNLLDVVACLDVWLGVPIGRLRPTTGKGDAAAAAAAAAAG